MSPAHELLLAIRQPTAIVPRSAIRMDATSTTFACRLQLDRLLRLDGTITKAIACKPKGRDFIIDRAIDRPAVARPMSVTGR